MLRAFCYLYRLYNENEEADKIVRHPLRYLSRKARGQLGKACVLLTQEIPRC